MNHLSVYVSKKKTTKSTCLSGIEWNLQIGTSVVSNLVILTFHSENKIVPHFKFLPPTQLHLDFTP